jgi:hypothetical protein
MASTALVALARYDEALAPVPRLHAVTPDSSQPYLCEAAAHAHRGDPAALSISASPRA